MKFVDKITVEKNHIIVEAVIVSIGNDFLIVVSGGDKPHIGAISFGNCDEEESIALGRHKELVVTQRMFQILKDICNCNLLITGGIHIDNITMVQITQVKENCDILTEKIVEIFNNIDCLHLPPLKERIGHN